MSDTTWMDIFDEWARAKRRHRNRSRFPYARFSSRTEDTPEKGEFHQYSNELIGDGIKFVYDHRLSITLLFLFLRRRKVKRKRRAIRSLSKSRGQ